MRRGDLTELAAFMAIADHLSFRAAAERLGVTPSALSHAMRQLEQRLGARLLNRTTRSVSVTDAGQRLLEKLRPAMAEVESALDDLSRERRRPYGKLRLHVSHLSAAAVVAPIWSRFLSTYPDVQLDVHVAETATDLVAHGFDAGIGRRDLAEADMVSVRVMGPMKMAMVATPGYFAQKRPPRTPDDLSLHDCIQYRLAPDGRIFEWPFKRAGKSWQIAVDGRVIVNTPDLSLRAALDGLGVAYVLETMAETYLRSRQLVRVLEEWSPVYEGLFLYYPGRRQVPAALRALIDMIRKMPRSTTARGLPPNPFFAESAG